jgi:SAM-dependent methyltransferase
MRETPLLLVSLVVILAPIGCSGEKEVDPSELPLVQTSQEATPGATRPSLAEESDPYWYRRAVGGMWEEIGRLQFDFLVDQGLKPEHYLLDVGCGALRGGIHFIRYLDDGHYFGIDIDAELLEAGRHELKINNLTHKNPVLVEMGDFDFQSLNQEFQFALALSVFTHLPLNNITRCMMNIDKVLVKGGRFYATIFENPQGKFNLGPMAHPVAGSGRRLRSYFDRNPYHYDVKTFDWICAGTSLKTEYIGYWAHPRDQKMLVFLKE